MNMFPIYNIYDLAESLVNLSDKEKESLQLHLNTQYGLHISVNRIVNEEELDKLAWDSAQPRYIDVFSTHKSNWVEGFKAGYRKAKQESNNKKN